jgi:hypothetical protein
MIRVSALLSAAASVWVLAGVANAGTSDLVDPALDSLISLSDPAVLVIAKNNNSNNSSNKRKQQQNDDDQKARRRQNAANANNSNANDASADTRAAISALNAERQQVETQRNDTLTKLDAERASYERLTRAYDNAKQSAKINQNLVDSYAKRQNPSSRARNRAQLAQTRVAEKTAEMASLKTQMDQQYASIKALKASAREDSKKLRLMQAEGDVLQSTLVAEESMMAADADDGMTDADDGMADANDETIDAGAQDNFKDAGDPAYKETLAAARSALEAKREALASIPDTGLVKYSQYALAAVLEAEISTLAADIAFVEQRAQVLTDDQAAQLASTLVDNAPAEDSVEYVLQDLAAAATMRARQADLQQQLEGLMAQAQNLSGRLTSMQASRGAHDSDASLADVQMEFRVVGQAIVRVDQELNRTELEADVLLQDALARIRQFKLTENNVPLNVDRSNDQVEFKFTLSNVGDVDSAITRLQSELAGIEIDMSEKTAAADRMHADMEQLRARIRPLLAQQNRSAEEQASLDQMRANLQQVTALYADTREVLRSIAYAREKNLDRTGELQLNRTFLTGDIIAGQKIALPQIDVLVASAQRQLASDQLKAWTYEAEHPVANPALASEEQTALWQAVIDTQLRVATLEASAAVLENETRLLAELGLPVTPRIPVLILDTAEREADYQAQMAKTLAEAAGDRRTMAADLSQRIRHATNELSNLSSTDASEASLIEAGIQNLAVRRQMQLDQANELDQAAQALTDQPADALSAN